jgi:dTDP-glucose 4,6-dehydratase
MTILVTGGAGFIGSNFAHAWCTAGLGPLVCLDKLTYAGNRANLASLEGRNDFSFVHAGIEDRIIVERCLRENQVSAVVNFAAESHVDRSIEGPEAFIQTNVVGTLRLLEAARQHWLRLEGQARSSFRFLHISTDEVYGTLLPEDPAFTEQSPFRPNSPYAASKASSDHLVRAYGETYGLPVLITNCSNNYGPYHFPEKLIPLIIHNALAGQPLPVYGDGLQVRDWLYVADHCAAIRAVLARGRPGETYNVGGHNEMTNIEVVRTICALLDERRPRADGQSYACQISFVRDRPGHDRRYAVDAGKIGRELGWAPAETFQTGIRKTIDWYLGHPDWVHNVTSGAYRDWVARQYA